MMLDSASRVSVSIVRRTGIYRAQGVAPAPKAISKVSIHTGPQNEPFEAKPDHWTGRGRVTSVANSEIRMQKSDTCTSARPTRRKISANAELRMLPANENQQISFASRVTKTASESFLRKSCSWRSDAIFSFARELQRSDSDVDVRCDRVCGAWRQPVGERNIG